MRLQVQVRVGRGAILESRHRVQVAVSAPDGALVAASERPNLVTTFRSCAKPFQLLPLVERGHAERWGLSDEQLAVMAASHNGSRYHAALVSGILSQLDLTEHDLECGFHEPLDPESCARGRSGAEPPSPLFNNCSGKHAGMLCLARSEGWPLEGYTRAGHPIQKLMRRTVAEVCGLSPEDLEVGIDGCSVSVFGLPLAAMARGYAVFATAGPQGSDRERGLHRIRRAMQTFPLAVGGATSLSTAVMQASGGRLVSKGGGEGLECAGLPERGLGLALKCEDGQGRAVGPALIPVLEHLGALAGAELEPLERWRRPVLHNHAGLEVGRIEAAVEVVAPAAT